MTVKGYYKTYLTYLTQTSAPSAVFHIFHLMVKNIQKNLKEKMPYFDSEYRVIIRAEINKAEKFIALVNQTKEFKSIPLKEEIFENMLKKKIPELYRYLK